MKLGVSEGEDRGGHFWEGRMKLEMPEGEDRGATFLGRGCETRDAAKKNTMTKHFWEGRMKLARALHNRKA